MSPKARIALFMSALAVGLVVISVSMSIRTGRTSPETPPATATTSNESSSKYSAYPGTLSPEAEAALNDPKNAGKWIGMVRGKDGKLHVDKVVDKPDQPKLK